MRCSPRPSSPSWPNSRKGSRASRQGASGTVAVSVVPAPSGLSTSSVPPSACRRSARPSSPEPDAGTAPPRPSSRTVATASVACWATATSTRPASAYFCAFVSASATR